MATKCNLKNTNALFDMTGEVFQSYQATVQKSTALNLLNSDVISLLIKYITSTQLVPKVSNLTDDIDVIHYCAMVRNHPIVFFIASQNSH